ncbi:MAG TPA: ATP synthase subunit I [Thiobacillus sp.]
MNEALSLVPALAAGVLLGGIFFGGLWWTVVRGVSSRHAALWFIGSMLLRTGVVLSGFYLVAAGDWKRLLASLLGFIVARLAVTRLVRAMQRPHHVAGEAGHAP